MCESRPFFSPGIHYQPRKHNHLQNIICRINDKTLNQNQSKNKFQKKVNINDKNQESSGKIELEILNFSVQCFIHENQRKLSQHTRYIKQ